MNLKEELLSQGEKIKWHPEFMKVRYENWVKGLKWDWCISRQRPYGIPIPVYYCTSCDEMFFPSDGELPVDPSQKAPICPKCGSSSVIADSDVMDTWATSSLTPSMYLERAGLDSRYRIMTARFQGHDIISTWAFTTILRSYLHWNSIPWEHIFISGNVLDAQGAKMSKSKGNTSYPEEVIDQYGADSMRFWASAYSMGEDARLREQELTRGRRTVIKMFNATKLVSSFNGVGNSKRNATLKHNVWVLQKLNQTILKVTDLMEVFELAKARLELDKFFWEIFCDDYLEICKAVFTSSDYDLEQRSETAEVSKIVMESILRMYAPFMPFITEECNEILGFTESIHNKTWPAGINLQDDGTFEQSIEIIHMVRALKSNLKTNGLTLKAVRVGSSNPVQNDELQIIKAISRLNAVETRQEEKLTVEAIESTSDKTT